MAVSSPPQCYIRDNAIKPGHDSHMAMAMVPPSSRAATSPPSSLLSIAPRCNTEPLILSIETFSRFPLRSLPVFFSNPAPLWSLNKSMRKPYVIAEAASLAFGTWQWIGSGSAARSKKSVKKLYGDRAKRKRRPRGHVGKLFLSGTSSTLRDSHTSD